MRVCIIHRGIGKQEENSFFSLHLYPIFMRAKEREPDGSREIGKGNSAHIPLKENHPNS